MKIVMTLLVRDEEDIVAANIDYHLSRGVDFVIATDNLSADGTVHILQGYERSGRLKLLHEGADDYAQHVWVTRMARMAATDCGADWVINNDADEFWWPEAGPDLRSCLADVPPQVSALRVPRFNFPILGDEVAPGVPFYEALVTRDLRSENASGRPLPPKVMHRAHSDIEVAQGNHAVAVGGRRLAAVEVPLSILHFPARSYAQFENKIRLGGAAYGRNRELPAGIGSTWRQLFALWQAGRLREHFDSQIPDASEAARRFASGRYAIDLRLKDYFERQRATWAFADG